MTQMPVLRGELCAVKSSRREVVVVVSAFFVVVFPRGVCGLCKAPRNSALLLETVCDVVVVGEQA